MEPTWNWKVPEGPRKFMKTQEKCISIWCHVQPKHCGTLAEVKWGWWVCSVFEKDIFSEVNALLKYRKVGRNQMFFHCSYCVQKEYYPYEIHLFSENRLLHVVILLDTISGCSSDFIHRSIEKCPPFRLRMMSKATACPVAHWRTAPTTRCLAHIFAICRKKHRSKKIRLGASWTLQLWLQWLDTVPYLKLESYIILLFDVEHLDFHMKLKSWKKLMVGLMTLEVGIYIYISLEIPSFINPKNKMHWSKPGSLTNV